MGIAIPQVVTASRATGSQVIDGSLKFDSSKGQFLKQTFVADGNKKTFTYSFWAKKTLASASGGIIFSGDNNVDGNNFEFRDANDKLRVYSYQNNSAVDYRTTAEYRDTSGWKHIVLSIDSTASDRMKLYVNGERVTSFSLSTGTWGSNTDYKVNTSGENHYIGLLLNSTGAQSTWFDGGMSQFYFIDGQALGPEYFGYTDGLTNTWKPKKYEGTFGTNGSYLPFDGNSPIGEDKSGITTPNDGTFWSRYVTISEGNTGTNYNEDATAWFDGDTSNSASLYSGNMVSPYSPTTVVFTPPSPITVSTGVRVYMAIDRGQNISINGTETNASVSAGWNDTGFTGTLTNLTLGPTNAGSSSNPSAIEIDGVILVDGLKGNSWTPVNFGGSVALDNPIVSGALPILNTTQGGTQAGVGVFGSKENKYYTVTTANGSVYQFDITSGDNPSLSFIRGATYKFDYSDHTSHPVLFSSTNPDSSTTAYTDGTDITSNVISFTVPHNAPDTLYYYCQNHPTSMNGSISVTTDETKADLYAWKNVLALPLVGGADDVSNQINSGSTTKVVTVDGAVASSAFSNFYGSSFEFDGTDDDLTIPDSADFNFGADDFTMEMWVYSDASQTKEIMGQRGAGQGGAFSIYHTGDNILLYVGSDGSSWDIVAGATIATNVVDQWTHIAVVRNGNHFLTFQDGVHKSTTVDDGTVQDSSSSLSIGSNVGTYFFDGKLSDIRIYKGVAKYTSDFVVPSTSPHILPDTPSGVSGGSKLTKITDGAVSFDGNSDYLYLGTNTDFTIAGDFTVEAFVYIKDSDINCFFNVGDYIGSSGFVFYSLATSRALSVYTNNTLVASGGEVRLNAWNHVALVRSGTTNTLYLDGKSVATFTNSSTFSGDANIGVDYYNSTRTNYTNGVISNLRYVNGTALYTSNFTPPTEPLTNVTNTKLLCCQSNTSALISAVKPQEGTYTLTGVNYSSGNQVTGSAGLTGEDNIFNGKVGQYLDTDNYARVTHSNDNHILWTPTNSISYSSKVEIYCYAANGFGITNSYSLNGAAEVTFVGDATGGYNSATWIEVATGSGTLTSLKLRLQRSPNNSGAAWYAVRIDGTVLVNDFSGEPILGNGTVAETNFNPFNTDIHTVRGQETGYATLNPLDKNSGVPLSNGNLEIVGTTTNVLARSTIFVSSGKWYYECSITRGYSGNPIIGWADQNATLSTWLGNSDNGWGYAGNAYKYNLDAVTSSGATYGSSYTTGDTIGVALDLDSGTLTYYKNGISQGVAFTNVSGTVCPATSSGADTTQLFNFGEKPFKFPPPDGFQSLNAANTRPVKVISRPDQYVGVSTYNGENNTRDIQTGFAPDLVFFKSTNATKDWAWYDSVRGVENRLRIPTTTEGVEATDSGGLTSFNYNGFTMGNSTFNNGASKTYVSYSFKAGGSSNTFNVDDVGYVSAAAAGLDAGVVTPSAASVGTKQGFSILKYTGTAGQSCSHGLTQAPEFIIEKEIANNTAWTVQTTVIDGSLDYLYLNLNSGRADYSIDAPTSTVFDIGRSNECVAYLWHSVPGLQKFGKYIGNGSADGPFVELGFRPAIVMVKYAATSGSAPWFIYDSERGKFNPDNSTLMPNDGGIEQNNYDIDFLSNGFKLRYADTAGYTNYAADYLYAAWAEAPSIDLYGGGANAR